VRDDNVDAEAVEDARTHLRCALGLVKITGEPR
jgi:hypothetical protein